MGDLSLARAVPGNVPDFNCGITKHELKNTAAVNLSCVQTNAVHLQPQCGLSLMQEEAISIIYESKGRNKSELEWT